MCSGKSFDEGYVAVNVSSLLDKKIMTMFKFHNILILFALLDKKIMTNVQIPQHFDSFRVSLTEITSVNNLPL